MKKLHITITVLIFIGSVLPSCRLPSPIPSPTPIQPPTLTAPSPAPTATPWPLQVELMSWGEQESTSREQLLQLVPNESTLQDVYALIGYPSAKKDFPSGIVLRYASELGKLPHTVLVDGVTGKVLCVSVYDFHGNFFYLSSLQAQYGNPVLARAVNQLNFLFFPADDIAVIKESRESDRVLYVQHLPRGITLEDYQANQEYGKETFAFTP